MKSHGDRALSFCDSGPQLRLQFIPGGKQLCQCCSLCQALSALQTSLQQECLVRLVTEPTPCGHC